MINVWGRWIKINIMYQHNTVPDNLWKCWFARLKGSEMWWKCGSTFKNKLFWLFSCYDRCTHCDKYLFIGAYMTGWMWHDHITDWLSYDIQALCQNILLTYIPTYLDIVDRYINLSILTRIAVIGEWLIQPSATSNSTRVNIWHFFRIVVSLAFSN